MCWLSGLSGCVSPLFELRGGDMCEDAFWLQSSLHETGFFTFPLLSTLCRLSGQSQWSLGLKMTKRCTEWEGSKIALQMRWGNVAVVRWAAE